MRRPKILYIGNKVSKHGKTATTIETLTVLLQNQGYEVVSTSSQKSMYLRLCVMLFQILKHCKSVNYVLIDTYSTNSFWYAFFCSQLARLLNLKYIPILHGGNLPDRLKKSQRLCKMIFDNAYINIAPSAYLQQAFLKHSYSNVSCIPNVIETKMYPFITRDIVCPRLLWVRSFDKIYNPEMAIKVLFEIKKTYNDASLTMVGPDKDGSMETCKQLAKKLNVEVNFTGKLSKNDWIKQSENCNIFLNTTHLDNTPVSVMEAMILGLPVVSTNVGGIPYLLTHNENAILVPDDALYEMTAAVCKFTQNKEFTTRIINNANNLIQQFDWKIIKKQWEEILK